MFWLSKTSLYVKYLNIYIVKIKTQTEYKQWYIGKYNNYKYTPIRSWIRPPKNVFAT